MECKGIKPSPFQLHDVGFISGGGYATATDSIRVAAFGITQANLTDTYIIMLADMDRWGSRGLRRRV